VTINNKVTNLIITGVGGQGNVLAARLVASVLLEEGYEVTVGDVYGLTQRGGSVASHVRWREKGTLPPLVPSRSLDILVAFEPLEALRVLSRYGNEKTAAVVNETPIMPIGVQTGRFHYPNLAELQEGLDLLTEKLLMIKATAIARELKQLQALNMVMLGALAGSGFTAIKRENFTRILHSYVPKKFVDINRKAFEMGINASSLILEDYRRN